MNNGKSLFGGKYYEGCKVKCVQRIRQKLINYRKLEDDFFLLSLVGGFDGLISMLKPLISWYSINVTSLITFNK